MGLTLNAGDARKGDSMSAVIRESGKYVGIITRAEKLVSKNRVEGLGLSFKTDDGASASYLDLYTIRQSDGEKLRGYHLVQALLACLKVRNVDEGSIEAEKWDNINRTMTKVPLIGYPALMGKRIGIVLQKELQTNRQNGKDVERLNVLAFFEAATGLTAIEILDGKTEAKRIQFYEGLIARTPVLDRREGHSPTREPAGAPATTGAQTGAGQHEFEDDIPF